MSDLEQRAAERELSAARVRRVADIERESIHWLWRNRIPLSKVSMLVGDPGLGKSMCAIALAAAVSRGARWPIDDEGEAPHGDAIFISAEDDAADTIRPRLEAVGADLDRCHVLDGIDEVAEDGSVYLRPWTLADLPALDRMLERMPECQLVVIDPVSAFLGSVDSHRNSEVRALLAPLSSLAAQHGVAIVCVTHLNKSGGPAIYRTTGSLAFVAAARAVYAVAADQDQPGRRLVTPVKANLAPDSGGLAYRIVADGDGTPRVEWESAVVEISADDALAPDADREARDERREACDWLRDRLAGGPARAKDVLRDAQADGFSKRTVQRARKEIGAISDRSGFGEGAWWSIGANPSAPTPELHRGTNDTDRTPSRSAADSGAHSRQRESPGTNGANGEHDQGLDL